MIHTKPKRCKECKNIFTPSPYRLAAKVCSQTCAIDYAKAKRLKAELADARAERADTKKRKEAIKRIPDLIKEAQTAFNAWVRCRDADKPCICCGQPLSAGDVGGKFDCGHYRSTGSASHLRFHEDNAHGQRKYCNRYGAGRAVDYRIGLIARVGTERVLALESSNEIHKWGRQELIDIRALYTAKLKALRAAL